MVGDKIEIVRIKTDGGYKPGSYNPGTHRAAKRGTHGLGLMNVLSNDGNWRSMNVGKDVEIVGAVVITEEK